MIHRALALTLATVVTTTLAGQEPAPIGRVSRPGVDGRAPMIESITQADLRADLFFLAGDAMRGRLTDTNENRLAAEYIRARFERAGLRPVAGSNSYFHNYNLMTASLGGDNTIRVPAGPGGLREFKSGQDFYPLRFSASGQVTGKVVFAGFGITAPKWNHDDYKGDVRGNIVMVIDHEPGERDPNSPFEGIVTAEPAAAWRKALAAQDKGAIGILFVSDVHNHPDVTNFEQAARNFWPDTAPRIPNYTLAAWADRIRIPAVQISPALAATLVPSANVSFADFTKRAEVAGGMTAMPLSVEITLRTSVDRHLVSDRNVLGLIEGSDPKLKDEWVLVTAHFDHDGVNGTQVLNGADDNGSGTVALLEIADAYALAAQQGQRPKRSVLFCAWNSEERGLLGAWAYTEHPPAPLANIAGVLNMDMIGRNEEVPIGGGNRFNGLEVQTAESNANAVNMMGYARAPELAAVVDAANAGIGLDIKKRYDNNASNLVRRSDQWPFLQRGVPALGFMTGLHPDYHTQYDRPEKINYAKIEKIARLIYQASWNLANAAARPKSATTSVEKPAEPRR
ncbi:MAG TPA: M28 family peptidase [Vicinamibacterales bacterium]|nr:M28 family peptidase [Vicinamibacterales bacterium]